MFFRTDGMKETAIIEALPEHFGKISEIEKECFSDPWSESMIAKAIENPSFTCFAAKSGESIVGYGFMYVVSDESEIMNIAVTKSFRRSGTGTKLMKKMISCAVSKGAAMMYLEVRESNIPAANLYRKLGFEAIGTRKNYYKNPTENAVLMAKELIENPEI